MSEEENKYVSFLLGYGGYAKIQLRNEGSSQPDGFSSENWNIVPLLNGNYDRTMTVPMQSTFSTPLNDKKRAKIRTGSGVYSYSGSIAFELTDVLRDLIFDTQLNFFKRNAFLDIELCDGEGIIQIPGAVWNSLNISGTVGGIINGSISFMTCNGYCHEITVIAPTASGEEFDTLPNLEPYWQYGGEGVQDFQLALTRNIMPVYLNEKKWIGPSYLRVGLMDASLSITCWEKWFDHNSIVLGNKTLSFQDGAFQNSRSYQFAGMGGEGLKTYTNNAVGLSGDGDLFVIN